MSGFGRKHIMLAWVAVATVPLGVTSPSSGAVLINELDSDTPTQPVNESAEFVELYNTEATPVDLAGLSLVFWNGNGDNSYFAIDLTGTIPGNGYYVIGNPNIIIASQNFPINTLQNGPDAVGIYNAPASSFVTTPASERTPVTATNLVDAVVYSTGDPEDPGLLDILTPGQSQVNEAGGGPSAQFSIGRFPDGAGGARNTMSWGTMVPTPGAANIPEPTSLGLFALGGLLMLRRRRA